MAGIFGVFGHPDAVKIVKNGLLVLQYRGEEGTGIAISDGKNLILKRVLGLVEMMNQGETFSGTAALGHLKSEVNAIEEVEPFLVNHLGRQVAVALDGRLSDPCARYLRGCIKGAGPQTRLDSELLIHSLVQNWSTKKSLDKALIELLYRIRGGYSLALLTPDKMIGVRDPLGIRPLFLGRIDGAYVLSSESCAIEMLGGKIEKEIDPGTIIVISSEEISVLDLGMKMNSSDCGHCSFEHIYFSRPDSIFAGQWVNAVQAKAGRILAKEQPAKGDKVASVPDSGTPFALGYNLEAKIPFSVVFVRSHFVRREENIKVLAEKLHPIRNLIAGQRLIVVDDSISGGTTIKKIVEMLQGAGAKEIHLRVGCPPIRYPCLYGVGVSLQNSLIAFGRSTEEIRKFIGADTLGYLSFGGLRDCFDNPDEFCFGCFTGQYPCH